jgi:cell division protein FtsA
MDKLSAGIVITGGGALLKHLPQLVKFKTGMDVRVGYPNEHLAIGSLSDVNHPMYSTAIGLLLKGYEYYQENQEKPVTHHRAPITKEAIKNKSVKIDSFEDETLKNEEEQPKSKSFLDNFKKTINELFEENDTKLN